MGKTRWLLEHILYPAAVGGDRGLLQEEDIVTNRRRFKHIMNFKPADRLPMIEWATWWDKTIARWKEEGLPETMNDPAEIRESLGLDVYRQYWYRGKKPTCPPPASHGAPLIPDIAGYRALKKHLYPKEPVNAEGLKKVAALQRRGKAVVWITLEGFFWFPRTLLGIQEHLYAFYDKPELIHAINKDILKYNLRVLDQFCAVCVPDFMTFAEDMSYNHGPMISKRLFDEFIAPYYRKITPRLKERGIISIVDSDGDVSAMVPWFEAVGVDGFLPLERQAGIDIVALRRKHPRLRMIGGYDKMVMSKGERAMRREFERLLPVMRQGGYIPSVDHQTPPGVSFKNYHVYLRLLKEYCQKALR